MTWQSLPLEDREAICKLDIDFAKRKAATWGQVFVDGRSMYSGQHMTADEVVLMLLHQIRMHVGNRKQRRASKEWLKCRGLRGSFGAPLDLN
jgi:hypothetical protein